MTITSITSAGSFLFRSRPYPRLRHRTVTLVCTLSLCHLALFSQQQSSPSGTKTILLDNYFNNERKTNKAGNTRAFHYLWNDTASSGFSILGNEFARQGASLQQLPAAPTSISLEQADVYIIVDPDNLKDNPQPNYMQEQYAVTIANWVKKGGVLLLMANDSANCDLQHFNLLAGKFGIRFSNRNANMVKKDSLPMGAVSIPPNNAVFQQTKKVYLKEISLLDIQKPARALVAAENGDVIMATAGYGKGVVFAVGDPWLYNEYTDGKRLPAEYENPLAAKELVHWLLSQHGK